MQLFKIETSGGAKRSLAKILREQFGVDEEVEGLYRMGDGGTNDDGNRHLVAQTATGRKFGLKTKARGGGPEGAKREVAYWAACCAIGYGGGCRAVCVEKISGLVGFEEEASAITEWVRDSKRVCDISAEEKTEIDAEIVNLIPQVAHWIAINLHFGLVDRGGLKNWVWVHKQRRLVVVDTESAWGNATIQDHHTIIDAFYGRAKLKGERGSSNAAIAFESALKEMHTKIVSQIHVISQAVAGISSASHYTSPFAIFSNDEFADRVFSLLA